MKKCKPEQIVTLLRQIEVDLANGKPTPRACRDAHPRCAVPRNYPLGQKEKLLTDERLQAEKTDAELAFKELMKKLDLGVVAAR